MQQVKFRSFPSDRPLALQCCIYSSGLLKGKEIQSGNHDLWYHNANPITHDDVLKMETFVVLLVICEGIHRSLSDSPHKCH